MDIHSEESRKKAYKLLEEGKPFEARKILAEILEFNLENTEISFAVWCCSFWSEFIRQLSGMDIAEQGEGLLQHWKSFQTSLQMRRETFSNVLLSVQTGIFNLALNSFKQMEDEKNPGRRADVFLKESICLKKLGKYEDSLKYLTQANSLSPFSASIMAEMADCYALYGLEKQAKVLFREAFFIDAQKIDLAFLDSELICCLIQKVRELKYTGPALQEWIPVYGVIFGIFNVKRELKSQEVGKLKQDIYSREADLKNPANDADILTPKLINMYFWLIDYYVQSVDEKRKIGDILLKIKLLDKDVHDLYTR